MTSMKERDLAGPGIGDYAELAHELPADYASLLGPRRRCRPCTRPSG